MPILVLGVRSYLDSPVETVLIECPRMLQTGEASQGLQSQGRASHNWRNHMGSHFKSTSRGRDRPLFVITTMTAVLFSSQGAWAACTGPGAPTDTQTQCLTAVQIPGNPLRSFDISWVNPNRAEYYLADRSNSGVDIIDTEHNTFKRRLPGFTGAVLNAAGTAVNNNVSGPDGVTSHGRWL